MRSARIRGRIRSVVSEFACGVVSVRSAVMATPRRPFGHGRQQQVPAALQPGGGSARRIRAAEADLAAHPTSLCRPDGLESVQELRARGVLGSSVVRSAQDLPGRDENLDEMAIRPVRGADALRRHAGPCRAARLALTARDGSPTHLPGARRQMPCVSSCGSGTPSMDLGPV